VSPPYKSLHRLSLCLAQSLIKDALESKLSIAFIDADFSGDLKEAVGGAHVPFQRGVAAADED
jgi:hypothetical protein